MELLVLLLVPRQGVHDADGLVRQFAPGDRLLVRQVGDLTHLAGRRLPFVRRQCRPVALDRQVLHEVAEFRLLEDGAEDRHLLALAGELVVAEQQLRPAGELALSSSGLPLAGKYFSSSGTGKTPRPSLYRCWLYSVASTCGPRKNPTPPPWRTYFSRFPTCLGVRLGTLSSRIVGYCARSGVSSAGRDPRRPPCRRARPGRSSRRSS